MVLVSGLRHSYGSGSMRRQVLQDISLRVDPGEVVLLTGPSGCGKTTLLTLIGALRQVQEGSVQLFGEELRDASRSTRLNLRRRPYQLPRCSAFCVSICTFVQVMKYY
jgi:putative ABC transport system ATP-binding protein